MAELKHLVRIANTDMNGKKAIGYELAKVKGIGIRLAQIVCRIVNIDVYTKLGSLPDTQIDQVEKIVQSLDKQNLPSWLLNRQKDYETGEDLHFLGNSLLFNKDNDIKRLRRIKTYRGIRHGLGQPTRGQRTRSHFRTNKGKAVAVQKKKTAPAAEK